MTKYTIPAAPVLTKAFPRVSRLTKTDDFSSVFNFRKRISGHFLAIHYQHTAHGHPRLGLIIAKKTTRLAVDRNYARRVLRELFRNSQHQLISVDMVVRTQRSFSRADYASVVQEFSKLTTRLTRHLSPAA